MLETSIAKPINTAEVPAEAATTPATAGIRNCPRRLPVSRVDTAKARSSGAVSWEISVIVNGWPTPSENPDTNTTAPRTHGLGENAIAINATIEMELLEVSNCRGVKRALSRPKK